MKSKSSYKFLKSSFHSDGKFIRNDEIIKWLRLKNDEVNININKIPFDKLEKWCFRDNSLKHDSGKFFSIDGISVSTNWGRISNWEQPIINQAEVGFLGFITKEFDGVLYFLMQAKIEPGNFNFVQLSPTLQATRSNYTQIHSGKKPLYLEYFQNAKSSEILLDQLQSEQGARFLKKRNRNIIIKVENDVPLYDNFIWLTLGQIKNLLLYDNLVNMDSRTVISGIPFGTFNTEVIDLFILTGFQNIKALNNQFLTSALTDNNTLHSIEEIITFLTKLKSIYDLDIQKKSLFELDNWSINDYEIYHTERKYFKVIAVEVEIGNREVIHWSQPMIEPAQEGLCAFVCKEINGVLHFAVQAKLECGNHDIIEFAPTVQCLTGNYRESKEGVLPFLDYVLNAKKEQIVIDSQQSEEGGRFYLEQNRNMIVIAGDDITIELPENFIWITLNQLFTFLKFNNYLNIQARSLISAISFISN